jgi:hypothetical protein
VHGDRRGTEIAYRQMTADMADVLARVGDQADPSEHRSGALRFERRRRTSLNQRFAGMGNSEGELSTRFGKLGKGIPT